MKSLGSMFAGAYASWLDSLSQCCAPFASCLDDGRPRSESGSISSGTYGAGTSSEVLSDAGFEKNVIVLRDQPGLVPPPSAEPLRPNTRGSGSQRVLKKSFGSSVRGSFSSKRRFLSNASSSRRPQISAPSNFRHIYSESFHFPAAQLRPQPRQRPSSFRPLELSIYLPENRLSPILPLFDYSSPSIAQPPRVRTRSSFDDDSTTLTHERSYSSMSFHVPRRPLREDSIHSNGQDESLPRVPPRARTRAYTSPSVECIVERIASAMLEKDRLQAEIDSIIERQSIYVNSRPSTAYGMPELEPMPSIPAMPAAAPSFAERLSTERPHTSPTWSVQVPPREKSPEAATGVFNTTAGSAREDRPLDRPLAPPLPLVLRPPLRKKKSFSRVSSWLFPGAEHQRDMSLDSITNLPKPITGREGYYQCVAPAEIAERTSVDTVSTASSWETEEDRTVPTSWSPGSSPATKHGTPTPTMDRTAAFGRLNNAPAKGNSVGVAF